MYLLSFTGVWVSLRQLREAFRNRKVVVGVFAFAGFCFFGALMLVLRLKLYHFPRPLSTPL